MTQGVYSRDELTRIRDSLVFDRPTDTCTQHQNKHDRRPLRPRGKRGGSRKTRSISVVVTTNAERRYVRPPTMSGSRGPKRPRTLVKINPTSQAPTKVVVNTRLTSPPSLYAINV